MLHEGYLDQAINKYMLGLMAQIFCGSQNFNALSKYQSKKFKMMILKLEQESRFM